MSVSLTATCLNCAVEYTNGDGVMKRDTVVGTLVFAGNDATTIPATGRWNIVVEDGQAIHIVACPLGIARDHNDVIVEAAGDIVDLSNRSTAFGGCAGINEQAHRASDQ